MIGQDFEQVLRAARDGDERAIAVLWRELHPRLLRYLHAVARDAAEDIESETWLRAAQQLDRFEGGEQQFVAWIFTIARSRLIDWQRRSSRRPSQPVAPHLLPEPAGREDPARDAIAQLDLERALELLRRLPPDQAEVVALKLLSGLDTERVASILGKRPGTVRVLQHRGLRRLAEYVGAEQRLVEEGVTP